MSDELPIGMCNKCYGDDGGNHEADCPNHPSIAENQLRIWNEMMQGGILFHDGPEKGVSLDLASLRKHWHAATGWLPPER